MSSYTKLAPQPFPNKQAFKNIINKNEPIKIKMMRSRKNSNLFEYNDYTSSINPFPRFNSVKK